MKCKWCGSYAINHNSHGRDGSDGELCDVCYWMKRADILRDALEYAIEKYGSPGGPWNVPTDPGGWIDRARSAIAKSGGKQ